jgi:hypothetical protein
LAQILPFITLLLVPLIIAVVIGLLFGVTANAEGQLFGIRFSTKGAVASYVIFFLLALFGYRYFVNEPRTYELTLNLRGEQADRDAVIAQLAAIKVTLTATSGQNIIFTSFAADSSKTQLRSSNTPALTLPSGAYMASVSPASLDRVTLHLADATLAFSSEMQATLDVVPRSTDPLTTQAVPFSRDDWVINFEYSQMKISSQGQKHIEELTELLIFRNETQQPLSIIKMTSYQIGGGIGEFEAQARAISATVLDAGLVDFRGGAVAQLDSNQILDKLDATLASFAVRGSQVGYFLFRNSTLVSDANRMEQFELLDGDTIRASISPAVQPGDGIVIVTKIKIQPDEKFLEPGKSDHFGMLTPYPTRLYYMVIDDVASDVRVDALSPTVEIKARSGQAVASGGDTIFRKSPDIAIFSGALADRDVTVRIHWAWQQGN